MTQPVYVTTDGYWSAIVALANMTSVLQGESWLIALGVSGTSWAGEQERA